MWRILEVPKDCVAVEQRSISLHAWATIGNAVSLALGILCVFFGASIGGDYAETLVNAGISFVFFGIIFYCFFEIIAIRCDRAIARLERPMPVTVENIEGCNITVVGPKARFVYLGNGRQLIVYDDEIGKWNLPDVIPPR